MAKNCFLGQAKVVGETTVCFFFWLCSDISLRQENRKQSKETNKQKNPWKQKNDMSPDFSINYTTERYISDQRRYLQSCKFMFFKLRFNTIWYSDHHKIKNIVTVFRHFLGIITGIYLDKMGWITALENKTCFVEMNIFEGGKKQHFAQITWETNCKLNWKIIARPVFHI